MLSTQRYGFTMPIKELVMALAFIGFIAVVGAIIFNAGVPKLSWIATAIPNAIQSVTNMIGC